MTTVVFLLHDVSRFQHIGKEISENLRATDMSQNSVTLLLGSHTLICKPLLPHHLSTPTCLFRHLLNDKKGST